VSKYIRIHENINPVSFDGEPLKDQNGNELDPITFKKYVRERAFDAEYIKGMDGLKRALEIVEGLNKAVATGQSMWELPDGHWRHLKDSIEKPTGGYLPWAWNLIPMADAVLDAKDKPPSVVEK
jgi:hypothetical protein